MLSSFNGTVSRLKMRTPGFWKTSVYNLFCDFIIPKAFQFQPVYPRNMKWTYLSFSWVTSWMFYEYWYLYTAFFSRMCIFNCFSNIIYGVSYFIFFFYKIQIIIICQLCTTTSDCAKHISRQVLQGDILMGLKEECHV